MPYIIQTSNLTRKYGSLTAVDSITLNVEKGEIFGILGPNGAGKTTLLSMLSTILKPTSGTATVNNYDIIRDNRMVRRSIGIVFQDPSIDADMTARENLQMHADLYGVPVSKQADRIKIVLELVQLEDKADHFMYTFSGGMRRRLEIARGLLHYPRVLFLDEPTIGLDPQSRDHIWEYIRKLREREDMTIILTTHYMEEADRLCDRVAIIDHGKIVALDQPSALKSRLGGDTIILGTPEEQKLFDLLRQNSTSDSIQMEKGEVRVTVSNANYLLPAIIESTVASGIQIDYIYINHPDMNDVFMHYTGKDIRQEQVREKSGRMAMMKRRRSR